MYLKISSITFHEPRGGKHLANVSITFNDPDGNEFITVHGIQLAHSNWDKDRHTGQGTLYCAVPCNFYRSNPNGQKHLEINRAVEWPLDVWREISREVIAAYLREHPEECPPPPLTPDLVGRMGVAR